MEDAAKVEIFGVDDSYFCIAGEGMREQGVFLSTKLKGIYDAPVTTSYKSSAYQIGATYKGRKYDKRDLVFGVEIDTENGEEWSYNNSAWRKAWDYEPDKWDFNSKLTRMDITSQMSGTRSLYLALTNSVDMESEFDPHLLGTSTVPMLATAAQPMWFQDDDIDVFETSNSSSTGFVTVFNPTPLPMAHKFVMTQGKWRISDVSWQGPKYGRVPGGQYGARRIDLPMLTEVQGGAVVDLDSSKLQVRDLHNTNLAALMNGKFFKHKIPPFTPPTQIHVQVTDAPPGGARLEVRMPRLWPSPWGGE